MPGRLPVLLWAALIATMVCGFCITLESRWFDSSASSDAPSGCFSSGKPILDLELARTSQCFQSVIDRGNRALNATVTQINTYMDFLFIFLYASVFWLFALLFRGRFTRPVVVLISLAAICDVLEDVRILQGVCAVLAGSTTYTGAPGYFSIIKWSSLALASIALGALLWSLGGPPNQLASFFLFVCGIILIVGLFVAKLMPFGLPALAVAFLIYVVRFPPWLPIPAKP